MQPQRVRIYGASHRTGPCTAAFAAAFPWDSHQGQEQLPIDGVLKNWGDFPLPSSRTPKAGGNLPACLVNADLPASLLA